MSIYQNSKIYKIESNKTPKIYIGSTTRLLKTRFAEHKSKYKNKKDIGNCSSYDILKYGDAKITLIEEYKCDSLEELHKREGYFIKNDINCVNIYIAGRTLHEYFEDCKDKRSDYFKKYNYNRKDSKKIYNDKYRIKNKETIKKQRQDTRVNNLDESRKKDRESYHNNKITCICGVSINKREIKRHEKTLNHNKIISTTKS